LKTRPHRDRLARTRRTLPIEQCARWIFRLAAPTPSPSTLGTRQRAGGEGGAAEAGAVEAEVEAVEEAEAEAAAEAEVAARQELP